MKMTRRSSIRNAVLVLASTTVPLPAKLPLPPGIIRIGTASMACSGAFIIRGWSFDCSKMAAAAIDCRPSCDGGGITVAGYHINDLIKIANNRHLYE